MSKLKRYSVNGVEYCYCRLTGRRIAAPFGTPEFDEELNEARLSYKPRKKPDATLPDRVFVSVAPKLIANAKRRAKARGCQFEIDASWVIGRIAAQKARCLLTGIPFDFTNTVESHHNPYAPSLDRIDTKGGYTAGNTRVVCAAINTMLSDWGADVFENVFKSYCSMKAS